MTNKLNLHLRYPLISWACNPVVRGEQKAHLKVIFHAFFVVVNNVYWHRHKNTYTHAHTHIYTHAHTHTHIQTYIYIYIYTYTRVRTHTHTHTHTHTYTNKTNKKITFALDILKNKNWHILQWTKQIGE